MHASSVDSELWDLPAEGTEMQLRVLKLLSLVVRSHHPHILAPSSITVVSPSSSSSNPPALHLQFPRATTALSLRDATKQGLLRSGAARRRIAFQLLSTVAFMHHRRIFHNFLTSDEILLSGVVTPEVGNNDMSTQSILLTHFFQSSITPVSSASYMCSRNYRPPEVILGYKASSEHVDIWLLGCLLFEIATGDAMFSLISSKDNGVMKPMLVRQQIQQIVTDIGTVSSEDVPSDFAAKHRDAVLSMKGEWQMLKRLEDAQVESAQDWNSLLLACLAFNPEKRQGAATLLKSALFNDLISTEAVHDYVEFETVDEAIASSAVES
ncbi:protein kinase, putative [Bodo saltans]|uniref:Protein kinase, putative n=1 Tax=Bodo saltans TaxID=75058 RepID=A0A0S4KFQ9_BODSA|nr:protein kinase, putative [Bodo saltans]|eukprot:CUI14430.1 protein kinase, putative [Bodo saltans]